MVHLRRKRKSIHIFIQQNLTSFYRDAPGEDKEEEKLESALNSAIVKEKPNVKWSDVAGLE